MGEKEGRIEKSLDSNKQAKIELPYFLIVAVWLLAAGAGMYYLAEGTITGNVVLDSAGPDTLKTVVPFEQQLLPFGTQVEIVINGEKTIKDLSVVLSTPPSEIFYNNATVYGWDEAVNVDVAIDPSSLTPGHHTIDVSLIHQDEMLGMKTVTFEFEEPSPTEEPGFEAVPVDELVEEPLTELNETELVINETTNLTENITITNETVPFSDDVPNTTIDNSTLISPEPTILQADPTVPVQDEPSFGIQACTLDSECNAECGGPPAYRRTPQGDCWADSGCTTSQCGSSSGSSSGGGGNSTQCGQISSSVTLIQNVISEQTCYTFSGNNIVLDCDGFNITYGNSTSASDVNGVRVGGNSGTIKNCNIAEAKNAARDRSAIFLQQGQNATHVAANFSILNNNITTIGNYSHGVYLLNGSHNINISDVHVSTKGNTSAGLLFHNVNNSISVHNSSFNTSGPDSPAVWLNASNYTVLRNFTALATGTNLTGDLQPAGIQIDGSEENLIINPNLSSTNSRSIEDTSGGTRQNWLIFNNSFGEIKWTDKGVGNTLPDSLDIATPIAPVKDVFIGNDTIAINSSAYTGSLINGTANVTLRGLNYTELRQMLLLPNFETNNGLIKANGTDCFGGVCTNISFASGVQKFNVSGFSSFAGNGTEDGAGGADTRAPAITMYDPANQSEYNHSTGVLNFTFSYIDNNATSACNVSISNTTAGVGSNFKIVNFPSVNNNTRTNVSFFASSFTNKTDQNWFVNCTDAAGNHNSTQLINFGFKIDLEAPVVTLHDPPDATTFNFSDAVLNFTWSATDNLKDPMSCNLSVANGTNNFFNTSVNTPNGSVRKNRSLYASNFTNASHDWFVTCVDDVGGIGVSDTRSFAVDLQGPDVGLVSPENNAYFNHSDAVLNFTFSTNDSLSGSMDCNITIVNGTVNKVVDVTSVANGTLGNYSFFANNFTNLTHTWFVICEDNATKSTQTAPFTFTIDQTAPTVSLSALANNTAYNHSEGELNFTWTATDDINATMQCNLTIVNGTSTKVVTLQSSNNTLDNYSFVSNEFTNSTHLWSVNCTDGANNVGSAGSRTFTTDLKPPTVALNAPPAATTFNFSDAVLNFTWTATEDVNTTVMCNLTIVNGTTTKVISTQSTNNTLDNFSLYAGNFTNATHEWNVTCTDGVDGVGSSANRGFAVDLQGPNVELTAPANNTYFNHSDGVLNFTFSTNDTLSGTMACNVTVVNGSTNKILNVASVANGSLGNYSLFANNFTNASHTWNVTCFDNSTLSTTTGSFNFTIDQSVPTVALNDPPDATTFNFSEGELNFTWTATDDLDASLSCNLTITNGTDRVVSSIASTSGAKTNYSFQASQFTNASHTWHVNCTDEAGNAVQSASRGFAVDLHAPAITLNAPGNNTNFNHSTGELNFTFTATDTLSGAQSCNITVGNGSTFKILNVAATNNTLTNFSLQAGNFTQSTHNWTVNCTDNSSQVNQSGTFFFTFDATDPTVNLNAPADATLYNHSEGELNFTWTATDNLDTSLNCNLTVTNGTDKVVGDLASTNGTKTNYSLFSGNFTNASHTWSVNCTDNVGNAVTSASRTFTVDQHAPAITLSAPTNQSLPGGDTELNFTFTATDTLSTSLSCNLTIGNGSVFKVQNVAATNNSLTNYSFIGNEFTNSTHNWTVNCTDAAGSINQSGTFFFTVDQTAPTVTLQKPDNDSYYNHSEGELNFTFNVTDAIDSSLDCNITIGNGSNYKLVNLAGTNGTLGNHSFFTSNFTNSTHNWTVNCTDEGKNTGTSGAYFFTVDQDNPTVSTVAPKNGTSPNISTLIEVAFNATDDQNISVAIVNISLPNETMDTVTLEKQTNDQYNGSYRIPNLTGSYNFTATANDTSGNVNFTVATLLTVTDQIAPTIRSISPANLTQSAQDSRVQISATIEDGINVSNASVNITFPNGTIIERSLEISGTTYNTSVNLSQTGLHNLSWVANDTADNRLTLNTSINSTVTETCSNLTSSKTLTANITSTSSCFGILRQTNLQLDCAGYTIIGPGSGFGLSIANSSGINITSCTFTNFTNGILIMNSTSSLLNNTQITNSSTSIVANVSSNPKLVNVSAAQVSFGATTGVNVEKDAGDVIFTGSMSGNVSNLSKFITIEPNRVFVNVSGASVLNTTANLTLSGLDEFTASGVAIEVDHDDSGNFTDCGPSLCKILSFVNGTLKFNVTHFTSFRAKAATKPSQKGGSSAARTIRATTGGGGGGGGAQVGPPRTQPSVPVPLLTSTESDDGQAEPVETQTELTQAVSAGVIKQFVDNVQKAEVRLPEVPPGANYAWIVPFLLPILLAVTSLSVPTPRRIFVDEESLYAMIKANTLGAYKKLYITLAAKQKFDPKNKYKNLVTINFTNKERYLINYLAQRYTANKQTVELLIGAKKKQNAKLITTQNISSLLQTHFKGVAIAHPQTVLKQTLIEKQASTPLEARQQEQLKKARPLLLKLLPQMMGKQTKTKKLDPQIRDYVVKARMQGITQEAITKRLAHHGWSQDHVAEALSHSDARLMALYKYVQKAQMKGMPSSQIETRVVQQGWDKKMANKAIRSIESGFSELLGYVRAAKYKGLQSEEIVKRLAQRGWDGKVVSAEVKQFNKTISKLLNYINTAKLEGVSEKEIEQRLVDFGWDRQEVHEDLALVRGRVAKLISYIETAQLTGMGNKEIQSRLSEMGWSKKDINRELGLVQDKNKKLMSYIRQAKSKGLSDAEIRRRLTLDGWDMRVVNKDLRLVNASINQLIEYLVTAKKTGAGKKSIMQRLTAEGWEESVVEEELQQIKKSTQHLIAYVENAEGQGLSMREIADRLHDSGWKRSDIELALQFKEQGEVEL